MSLPPQLPDRILRHWIRGYRTIDGFLTEPEALALYRTARRPPAGAALLEIGSWQGKSTYCLARGMPSRAVLHCIDPFDASGEPASAAVYREHQTTVPLRQKFEANLGSYRTRLEIHAGYSRDFIGRIPPLHLLFIDGDHSLAGARFDFENFASLLKPGGYLLFHDYYPNRPDLGPTWVIEQLIKTRREFAPVAIVDSLWIGRRTT